MSAANRKEVIMKEYIVEFGDALYDEKTGQAVFRPKIVGELIRCKYCKYWDGYYCHHPGYGDGYAHYVPPIKNEDGFCDWAEKKEADS